MGLKASTTCELTFGARRPAVGTLVGGVHDGIRQMFMIIEHARMMVGTKAIATLSTGYLNALDFARSRVQGADLTQMADKSAPRVTIMHHPDVRRMLMMQKAYAEGMRALVLYTASLQDALQIAAASGEPDPTAAGLNDLLLPVVKGVGSERAYELLGLSLQTLGGSGYLQDYPIEQYIRDAKIDSLYEGTTGIQGLDLFFRKILRDEGRSLRVAAGPDRGVRQRRVGQRAAQAGADRPRPGGRGRGGHGVRHGRLRRRLAGAPGRDLPGRPQHHQAADGPRRPGDRLAARPPGRGGPGGAGRAGAGPAASATGTGRSTRASSPPSRFFAQTVLPRLAVERRDRRGDHARADGAARRGVLTGSGSCPGPRSDLVLDRGRGCATIGSM